MPGYSLQKLPNEPIIVFIIKENFSVSNELESSANARTQILDAQPEPTYCIMDYTKMSFTFDELIAATNKVGRGAGSLFHHPNIRKLLLVVPSAILQQTVKGMTTGHAFGKLDALMFDTLDDALEFARSGK